MELSECASPLKTTIRNLGKYYLHFELQPSSREFVTVYAVCTIKDDGRTVQACKRVVGSVWKPQPGTYVARNLQMHDDWHSEWSETKKCLSEFDALNAVAEKFDIKKSLLATLASDLAQ